MALRVPCTAGASRTDAGAHAVRAVAHLDVVGSPDSIQPDSLMMYLNGVLPADVKVQHIQLAPEGARTACIYCLLVATSRWLGEWVA